MERVYTIKSGDTLWDIASESYGDPSKWTDIYQANRGVLGDNPDLIFPGQQIVLPGLIDEGSQVATAPPMNSPSIPPLPSPPPSILEVPILKNPYYAFVEFQLGEFNLTPVPPEYNQSFTFEDLSGVGVGKFTFELFDATALQIEAELSRGHHDVLFRFGYTDGLISPLFGGMVLTYDLNFESGGAHLTLLGSSKSLDSMRFERTKSFSGLDIHEIVALLAQSEGWRIGYIEQTLPIFEYNDNKSDVMSKKEFRQSEPTITFIKNTLRPRAVSSVSKEGGYQFYFRDLEGIPHLFFHPPHYFHNPSREYLYLCGLKGQSGVISFNPEIIGVAAVLKSGVPIASYMDSITHEIKTKKYDGTNNPSRDSTGSWFHPYSTSSYRVNASSENDSEFEARLKDMWGKMVNFPYPANMEIPGDPVIAPRDTINIKVITESGLPHHTSGQYMIRRVVHTISGGSYVSNLDLLRNSMNQGPSPDGGTNVNR